MEIETKPESRLTTKNWSIVMPVFNESAIIEKVIESFESAVLRKLPSAEFILVDDASTDNTPMLLDKLASRFSSLKVLHNTLNGGHGAALLKGFREASGDFIFHCDSDNQHDPEDFWKLQAFSTQFDVTLGVRTHRQDPLVRKVITRLNRLLCRILFGSSLQDLNSPFKIYSRTALNEVLGIISPLKPFAPSIEMALTAQALGRSVKEVPVTHWPRRTGKISIVRWSLVKACLRTATDLFKLRRILKKGRDV